MVCTQSAFLGHIKLPPKAGKHESRAPRQPPRRQGERRAEERIMDSDCQPLALPLPCCVTSQTHLTTLCLCFLICSVSSVQSLSRVRLCDPMDCSTPGLRVHHQLPEFTQNSCPLSRSCHPTISSSVVPFFSHLQSFPASGSFQMSQFFTSDGQSIGVSASASFLPMNVQD